MTVQPLDPWTARSEVEVEASAERVWAALTDSRDLEGWFPLEARVEPGESGRLVFEWGGGRQVTWRIHVWERPHHLRLVTVGPQCLPDLTTEIHLRGDGARAHIRVATSGFPEEPEWRDLVRATGLGYRFLLLQLRQYLQHHDGRPRRVLSVRHRVDVPREEAWERIRESQDLGLPTDRVLDRCEPWQLAATAPAAGLYRLAIDPVRDDPGCREVSLWLSAWSEDAELLDRTAGHCCDALADLFPGGQAVATPSDGDRPPLPDAFAAYALI